MKYFLLLLAISSCTVQSGKTGSTIKSHVRVPLTIEIPSNLGEGHQWMLFDTTAFRVVSHDSKTNPDKTQSTDLEVYELLPLQKGNFQLTFYYLRPFDKVLDTANAKKTTKTISIK